MATVTVRKKYVLYPAQKHRSKIIVQLWKSINIEHSSSEVSKKNK